MTSSVSNQHEVLRRGLLNPELDIGALATAFQDEGRLQIEDALRPEVAELLYQCLHHQVPWSLAFRDRDGPRKLWAEELAAMTEAESEAMNTRILDIAREQFQFRYDSYMMVTAYKEKRDPDLVLHRMVEQINTSPWLNAMRRITGRSEIRRSDAQATRYIAGHFLKMHNDIQHEEGRVAAYVLNLTRNWEAHWGGLLQFLDENGEVEQTFMPRFNTITLFSVPAEHCVSPVAEFASSARYAVTGWLRT